MFKFEKSILIDRPQQEVFDYVTNFANDSKWQSGIESVEQTSEGPIGAGSTLLYKVKFLGREIETVIEVTGYDSPNQASVKSIAGPVPFENTYNFESRENGTQLSIIAQAEIGGFFKMAEGLVGKQVEKQMDSDAAALKKLLEAGS
jgi:carbon monoxide dehydrogenase subunit G